MLRLAPSYRAIKRSTAVATLIAIAACSDPTTQPRPSGHLVHDFNAQDGAPMGFTDGWSAGKAVLFRYSKAFFCQQPPSSGAPSQCEAGMDGTVDPRPGVKPILFVMTPLGFRPAESTLQCPVVGSCINHPGTLDVSRVLGKGTENISLPAHSHIIGNEAVPNGANAGWWEIKVVGVTSPAVWDQIVAGKSLATVRSLQAAGTGITGDIPTNLYLFFDVRPS